MRFLNIQTLSQSTQGGDNCYPETDERVKNWFEPTPKGYKKSFDDKGFPFNELIPPKTAEEIQEEEKSINNTPIYEQIKVLETKCLRPLLALNTDPSSVEDKKYLDKFKAEIEALKLQLI